MTENQVIHHQEQMTASRVKFNRMTSEIFKRMYDIPIKQGVNIEKLMWTGFIHSKGLLK